MADCGGGFDFVAGNSDFSFQAKGGSIINDLLNILYGNCPGGSSGMAQEIMSLMGETPESNKYIVANKM